MLFQQNGSHDQNSCLDQKRLSDQYSLPDQKRPWDSHGDDPCVTPHVFHREISLMVDVPQTVLGEMCSVDVEVAYNMSCYYAVVELKVAAASMWVPTLLGVHGGDLRSAKNPYSSVGHCQTFLKLGNIK